jgi:hypothetical protein
VFVQQMRRHSERRDAGDRPRSLRKRHPVSARESSIKPSSFKPRRSK